MTCNVPVSNWASMACCHALQQQQCAKLGGTERFKSPSSLVTYVSTTREVWLRRIPLPFNNVAPGYIEWLYLDEDLRVTRGNKGSYFIHTRM